MRVARVRGDEIHSLRCRMARKEEKEEERERERERVNFVLFSSSLTQKGNKSTHPIDSICPQEQVIGQG